MMVVVTTSTYVLYQYCVSKMLADQYSFHSSQQSPVHVKLTELELDVIKPPEATIVVELTDAKLVKPPVA